HAGASRRAGAHGRAGQDSRHRRASDYGGSRGGGGGGIRACGRDRGGLMSDAIEWRSRIRLVDEVVEVLRERILSGHYPPGSPLRQEQLAAEFRISRTPLREALRMLESEGLVSVAPGRGARVIAGDRQRLLAAYELREVIDGLGARLAAARGGPAAAER